MREGSGSQGIGVLVYSVLISLRRAIRLQTGEFSSIDETPLSEAVVDSARGEGWVFRGATPFHVHCSANRQILGIILFATFLQYTVLLQATEHISTRTPSSFVTLLTFYFHILFFLDFASLFLGHKRNLSLALDRIENWSGDLVSLDSRPK